MKVLLTLSHIDGLRRTVFLGPSRLFVAEDSEFIPESIQCMIPKKLFLKPLAQVEQYSHDGNIAGCKSLLSSFSVSLLYFI